MDIDLLIKLAPIIPIFIGFVKILKEYYNTEFDKYNKLEEKYFENVLVKYFAKYNENANINPVRFMKQRYARDDYFIPEYIFYLIRENKKEDLHKVLVVDYKNEFSSELNCYNKTLKRIGGIACILGLIVMFWVVFVTASSYAQLVKDEFVKMLSKGTIMASIMFIGIMIIIVFGIIGGIIFFTKQIIINPLKYENKYTFEESCMIVQIERKKKIYDDKKHKKLKK